MLQCYVISPLTILLGSHFGIEWLDLSCNGLYVQDISLANASA
jgi:hypothetical protein